MTKPLPEWKQKDRALARRARAVYRPQVGKLKAAPNHELIRLPGNRPGDFTLYTRRTRDSTLTPKQRKDPLRTRATMPYRKARTA